MENFKVQKIWQLRAGHAEFKIAEYESCKQDMNSSFPPNLPLSVLTTFILTV